MQLIVTSTDQVILVDDRGVVQGQWTIDADWISGSPDPVAELTGLIEEYLPVE